MKKKTWEVIDYVSSIRQKWKVSAGIPQIGPLAKSNPLLYYQFNSRLMDVMNSVRKANSIDAKRIIDEMFELSETAWAKVKKDANRKI